MKLTRKIAAASQLVLLLLALTAAARAQGGDVGFLDPTHTTIVAGQPFSWMEIGRDWDGITLTPAINGNVYAVPSVPQNISVETWRTSTNLMFRFLIFDNTRRKPDLTTLNKGDRLIIQLDPNNSGHAAAPSTSLSAGPSGNIATDYRFEIVIKDNLIFSSLTGARLAADDDANPMTPNNWGPIDTGAVPGLASVSIVGNQYQLDVSIPLSFLGLGPITANTPPVGITFVYLNDIGHSTNNAGVTWELTGSEFPSSMGLTLLSTDVGVSPDLVTPNLPSNSWLNPSQWGAGYFNVVPGGVNDVQFSHAPEYVFSSSIRIGECTTTKWDDIQPVVSGATNQLTLQGWYKYHPGTSMSAGKPCQMKVWFQVNKNPAVVGSVRRRFLILWGRPGISPTDWFVVNLSPPVTVSNPTETFNFLWNSVPKVSFTSHPCLRIYALPENLTGTFMGNPIDEAFINGIDTQTELNQMESAYAFPSPVDSRSAQMNFTAIVPAQDCPAASNCQQASAPGGDDEEGGALRVLKASFNAPAPRARLNRVVDDAATTTAAARAQRTDDRGGDYIRIFIEGYGAEVLVPTKDYTYIEPLGAVGNVVAVRDLVAQGGMTIEVEFTNPAVLRRDVTATQPAETRSPPRDVFINVRMDVPQGVPKPTINVQIDRTRLGPGETTKGVIRVTPGGGPDDDDFKPWGLSFHAGVSIPHGDFNDLFNPGPNVGVDLEYRLNRTFSGELIYTYHRFRGDTVGAFTLDDVNLHQLSLNGKVYGNTAPVRPFFNFGGGVYVFHPGANAHGGLNFGGGVQFDVTPTFAVETMYNFHNVFTSGSNTQFSTVQGGVRFRF